MESNRFCDCRKNLSSRQTSRNTTFMNTLKVSRKCSGIEFVVYNVVSTDSFTCSPVVKYVFWLNVYCVSRLLATSKRYILMFCTPVVFQH